MQVFLTVFFSCLPLALALPQPHPSDAPTTTSLHSPVQSFTLSNITYESHLTYSTPAHVASSYATLTFNLTDSRAYKASCSAFDSGGIASWFNYPQNFTCTRLTGEYLSGDGSFMYVGYSLQVNETWNADGYVHRPSSRGWGIIQLCESTEADHTKVQIPGCERHYQPPLEGIPMQNHELAEPRLVMARSSRHLFHIGHKVRPSEYRNNPFCLESGLRLQC